MPASKAYPPAKYWDESWNFVYGCTPVGAGCKNCWARRMHEQRRTAANWRLQTADFCTSYRTPLVYRQPFENVQVFPGRLDMPLHWKKPRVVAVNFSGDTFHKKVPANVLGKAWRRMEDCPQHTFIVLTKRWERMCSILKNTKPLPNVQLGVSVSTQAELKAAMPHLLATPAAVRLLSLEPLLEGMTLPLLVTAASDMGVAALQCGAAAESVGIHGIIVGCESGPNRRPCKLAWVRSIVEQCKAAGVKCFVKQMAKSTGRVLTDPNEWPDSIRGRELPQRENS